jgi:GNAT superfamily N-acetyltransferase
VLDAWGILFSALSRGVNRMDLYITNEFDNSDKSYVRKKLIEYNLKHIPENWKGRSQEINLILKDEDGQIYAGILTEICWNWLEVHILWVDEKVRKLGYGKKLLSEVEKIAKDKNCDFIKLDTLSFQALDFYKKQGYEIFGSIENAAREHTHYYLKKDI